MAATVHQGVAPAWANRRPVGAQTTASVTPYCTTATICYYTPPGDALTSRRTTAKIGVIEPLPDHSPLAPSIPPRIATGEQAYDAVQRVLAAVNRERPDRTPADYKAEPEVNRYMMERLQVDDYESLLRRLEVDVRRLEPRYVGPPFKTFEDGVFEDYWGIRSKHLEGRSRQLRHARAHAALGRQVGRGHGETRLALARHFRLLARCASSAPGTRATP